MTTLYVRVTDIDSYPIEGAKITVQGGTKLTSKGGQADGFVLESMPTVISVEHSDYAGLTTSFRIVQRDGRHNIEYNASDILFAQLTKSGDEYSINVTIPLGILREPSAAQANVSHWKPALKVEVPRHPTVGDGPEFVRGNPPEGWNRLPHDTVSIDDLPGEFIWAERMRGDAPKLIAIWKPAHVTLSTLLPTNYLLYFTPVIPGDAKWGPYPYGEGYQKLGHRYLLAEKRIAYHLHHSKKNAIAVVPIGQKFQQFQGLGTQSGAFKLLREVNFFLHRRAKKKLMGHWMKQCVGKVALCGFSSGADYVMDILNTAGTVGPNPEQYAKDFYNYNLREIWNLDGAPVTRTAFNTAVHTWYRGGSGERMFRIYSKEFDYNDSQLDKDLVSPRVEKTFRGRGVQQLFKPKVDDKNLPVLDPHKKPILVPAGEKEIPYTAKTVERHHPDGKCSVVLIEQNFFWGINMSPDGDSHQFFPRYFLGHALRHSKLD